MHLRSYSYNMDTFTQSSDDKPAHPLNPKGIKYA